MVKVKRPTDDFLIIIVENQKDKDTGTFLKINNDEIESFINLLDKEKEGTIKHKEISSEEVKCSKCRDPVGDGHRITNENTKGMIFLCDSCIKEFHEEAVEELKKITPEIISEEI